jgi:VanZ family protein
MTTTRRLPAMPFVLAIAVAVAVVLSAPFVGRIRDWIRDTFPGHFVLVVGVIGGIVLAAAFIAAARQIRERRSLRYGAIAGALVIAVVYSIATADVRPESRAVERFHFLEYGLMAFLFYRAWRPLGDFAIVLLPVLAGVIVGTVEEWFQWFIPRRVGEMRDVFLNLVAIGCGLFFSIAVLPPASFQAALQPTSRARVSRLAAVTVLALALFVQVLHLGYAIADTEAGTFTSRYSGAQLLALQEQKATEWRTDPPPLVLRRLSREDQYLSEGIEHVMHRNELWAAGDIAGAWQENLILEKYFVPVLDTPTYAGRSGHRWSPEQRADAEARAKRPNSAYVSEAYPYRILTWNKWLFWTVAGGVAGVLLAAARGYTRVG